MSYFSPTPVLQRHCSCGGVCSSRASKQRRTLQRAQDPPAQEIGHSTEKSLGFDFSRVRIHDDALQRRAADSSAPLKAPPIVHEVLRSPGQPLERSTREFMESGFGQDFSRVRVHTDPHAVQSARAVDALAYAANRHIVFGSNQYRPFSTDGRLLIAHELAHTLQQGAGIGPVETMSEPADPSEQQADRMAEAAIAGSARNPTAASHGASAEVRRAPAEPGPERDVVIVLSKDIGEEAEVLAPGALVIREDTLNGLIEKLGAIPFSIRTLYISAHSSPLGDIVLGHGQTSGEGLVLNPQYLSAKLRGVLKSPPRQVDFRGCSLGSTPVAVEKYRSALGAESAIAGNCYYGMVPSGSISIGGKTITDPKQLNTPGRKAAFDDAFPKTIAGMKPYEKCILDRSQEGFFRGKGHLYAVMQIPDLNKPGVFQCLSAIQPEEVDPSTPSLLHGKGPESCKRIVVRAPDAAPHGTKIEKE